MEGYSPQGHKKPDTTEAIACMHTNPTQVALNGIKKKKCLGFGVRPIGLDVPAPLMRREAISDLGPLP